MAAQADLFGMALELLQRSNDALATTPAGAIDRALVSVGEPAFDCCPQLSVHWITIDKDVASPNQAPLDRLHRLRGGSINVTSWAVNVIRCVPGVAELGRLPTATELTASSEEIFADGWALWNELQRDLKDGTLWAGFPCRELWISPMIPIAPQGNCAGIRFLLQAQLDGYRNAP